MHTRHPAPHKPEPTADPTRPAENTGPRPAGLPAATLPAVELAAVVALVTVDLWLVWDRPWLLALTRALAAAVLIASLLRRRKDRPAATPGMSAGRAWTEAAVATLVLAGAVLAWSAAVSGPFDEPDLTLLAGPATALGLWLLRHLVLAWVQQLVLQLYLWPVAREVLKSSFLTTATVAMLFGLFHLPSPSLAIATAIAGGVWLLLYRRSGRLAPLIASHVLLAATAATLPDRLFYDMEVGAPALEVAADQRSLAGEEKQALLTAVSSPGYAAYRGGTDRGYIDGLYRDILGRVPTDGEVADGVEQLARISRLSLAKRMLLAQELDDATLWRRVIDDEPLPPGVDVTPSGPAPGGAPAVTFAGWYAPEESWRWAHSQTPEIGFHLELVPERVYVLTFSGGVAAHVAQGMHQPSVTVALELNGDVVGSGRFTDFSGLEYGMLLDPGQLAANGNNRLRFLITSEGRPPGDAAAAAAFEGDPRALGFGLRRLRIAPLRFPSAAVLFDRGDYFLEGFSIAEERLRWTHGETARLAYPLPEVVPGGCYNLWLRAGAFERQQVGISINGRRVADWTFDGLEPQIRFARLDARWLRSGPNLMDFHLPGARRPEGDPRRLALALMSLRIYPLEDCS